MGGTKQAAQLVRFWRAVEMFSPQDVPDLTSRSNRPSSPLVMDVAANQIAPWDRDHPLWRDRLPAGMTWQFTVYGGVYDVSRARDELIRVFGADRCPPDGRPAGATAMFAFTLDAQGRIVENSPILSACAWAISRLRSPGPHDNSWLDGFEDDHRGFITGLNKMAPPKVGSAREELRQSALSRAAAGVGRQARAAGAEAIVKGAGSAATVAATAAATALGGPVLGGIAGTVAGTFAERMLTRRPANGATPANGDESTVPNLDLTSGDLHDFINELASALGIKDALGIDGLRVKCVQVRERYAGEASDQDFLNSFIANDLARVETAVQQGDVGDALRGYLSDLREIPAQRRVDVRTRPETVVAGVSPLRFPTGRWPGDVRRPLVLSQQFAVNQLMAELRDSKGVFAVNGPPGTGKTTMLRDALAAIVVERATQLAELDRPAAAFTRKIEVVQVGENNYKPAVYELLPTLTGFEVVVATASNDAATNVTAEIPAVTAVSGAQDEAVAVDYFTDLASLVLDGEAWGLITAVLGKMTNRRDFVGRFWFGNDSRDQPVAPQTANETDANRATPQNIGMKDTLTRASAEPATVPDWAATVRSFKRAQQEVRQLAEERQSVANAIAELARLDGVIRSAWADILSANEQHEHWGEQHRTAQERCRAADAEYRQAAAILTDHDQRKPGFWVSLSTWFRAGREWSTRSKQLVAARDSAKQQLDNQIAAARIAYRHYQEAAELGQRRVEEHLDAVAAQTAVSALIEQARQRWPGTVPFGENLADEQQFQLCNAWADKEFTAARHRLFLEALTLHKAFTLNTASQMRGNLAVATSLIRNQVKTTPKPETIVAAWQTLFLVVPMVSTTFASLPRLFKDLHSEALGWLFVDEAGQATPQQVAGGIWRARRAAIVGDPQQLEPIVTLPFPAQQALLRHHRLDEEWTPDFTSAQRVADRLARHGTALADPNGDTAIWVGSPLRVHRRCDRPMFEVSNRIAYGGDLMIYGTPDRGQFVGENTWFDIPSNRADGNWIPAEGEQLRNLLDMLTNGMAVAPNDIRVVSPFRDVVRGAKSIARQVVDRDFAERNVGTVHTVQGQEADVVILVLGTPPEKGGARAWASAKPNLLNVAVSRARRRFYVIGNRRLWREQQYFSVLATELRAANG
ncbi:DEAD/DEAH box helicase [Nocardia sp. NPDC052278]|uniref:DEAD/DEAH box helicase n=1 Tax=unclassified Nocardia TaxID=2637762 RepID=UPI00369F6FE5